MTGGELGVLAGDAAGVAQGAAEGTGEADVTIGAAQVAAEVTGDAAANGEVAAWAWREDMSKMARIPAASIAACIAR